MRLDNLIVSPCSNPELSLDEALAAYSHIGYRKFEVFTAWVKSALDVTQPAAFYREKAARRAMRYASLHLPPVNDDVETSLAAAVRAARFAKEIGASIVLYKATSRANYIKAGRRFLDAIEGLSITPVLQNHAGTAIATLEDFRQVLEEIDDPRVKALLEVGHFHSVGVSWREGCGLLGDRIALVHIKDQIGRQSVPFGSGEIDLPGLFAHMDGVGYAGDYVVEMEVADRENTLDYLADAFRYVGRYCEDFAGAPVKAGAAGTPLSADPRNREKPEGAGKSPRQPSDPRICIIGAGALSTMRIYPYLGAAGARLAGVCDLDLAKARRNAGRFGGEPFTDWEVMIDGQKPDGVIVCVGPQAHAELAPRILRKGIPVYTEKPPAPSAAAALEVARAAKETGVLCTTAFKKRYNAAYSRAKQWIESRPPESLYSISVDYASAGYPNDGPARGSFLLDFAIHLIDLVGYLLGDVAEVFAFSKGPNAYAVSLRFANGAVGSMNLTDGRSFSIPTEEVEITARGGNWITIHNSSVWRIVENGKATEWREPPTFVSGGDSGNETGHLAEIADFVAAIREGRTTRSNICESYKSMVLYEAIRDSAASGRVVALRYEEL